LTLFRFLFFFFFNDTATTEIYTLSLHDALPISFVDLPSSLGAGKFHAGLNTITFIVENVADQSPASLRVEGVITATPVPEPGAAAALLGTAVFVALLNPRACRYPRRLDA